MTSNNPQVQIYGPSFSNFVRTLMLLCEEHNIIYSTGFELDEEKIEFKGEKHFALHPFAKLPVLKHGDFILPETASIARYLLKTFVKTGNDTSIEQEAKIDAFSALASLYIDKAIVRDYILEFAFPKGEQGEVRLSVAKEAQSQVNEALSVISQTLADDNILNGKQLTIADMLLAPMLHYLSCLPKEFNLLPQHPKVEQYLTSLMARASCQKVLVAMDK